MAGVTQDATSLIYVPSTAGDWTQTMSAAGIASGNPSDWWLCQEASGNLASGGVGVTLTANGTPLYQQTVTGWTRKGVGLAAGANQRFTAGAGVGPSPATTSQLWIWYMSITATPGVTAIAASISDGATNYRCAVNTTPRVQSLIGGVTGTGASDPTSAGIMPVVMLYDRTNSVATVFTGQDKITNTYTAGVVDGRKGIGGATAITGQVVFGALFQGSSAELSAAQIKTLLVTLAWTIPWT